MCPLSPPTAGARSAPPVLRRFAEPPGRVVAVAAPTGGTGRSATRPGPARGRPRSAGVPGRRTPSTSACTGTTARATARRPPGTRGRARRAAAAGPSTAPAPPGRAATAGVAGRGGACGANGRAGAVGARGGLGRSFRGGTDSLRPTPGRTSAHMREQSHVRSSLVLRCTTCGNEDRFEEVSSFSVNLLNRDMTYKRSLWNEVDMYRCCRCGAEVEPKEVER